MKDIKYLNTHVQELAAELIQKCKAEGVDIIVTQTLRTFREQNALYAQGRTTPGRIVTNARGGDSIHNYGLAFDIAVKVNGKVTWNDKYYVKPGQIGKSIGLTWGGDFKSIKDYPHFQWTNGLTLHELKEGKKPTTQQKAAAPTEIKTVNTGFSGILKIGSRGSEVKTLQSRLNAKGFKCTADGIYGYSTMTTVQHFQAKYKLKPDGVVRETTWSKLFN